MLNEKVKDLLCRKISLAKHTPPPLELSSSNSVMAKHDQALSVRHWTKYPLISFILLRRSWAIKIPSSWLSFNVGDEAWPGAFSTSLNRVNEIHEYIFINPVRNG